MACRDAQIIDGRLIHVFQADEKIHMWDAEKGELWGVDFEPSLSSLRISGDRSKIFCLDGKSIQAYSIWTGKLVSTIRSELYYDFLIVDGSSVWMCKSDLESYEGWHFETPHSLPVQMYNNPPQKLHPSGAVLWDAILSRIEDMATEKVFFQLSRRFSAMYEDMEWNGQHLILCNTNEEILILDFSYLLLL
jgi:hypothetical protein